MTVSLGTDAASDASQPVITLITAVRGGWSPPTEMSDATYSALRARRDDVFDPIVCFAGHCASWGGKWFGGLARGHKRQREPIRAAAKTLIDRVAACAKTSFACMDYSDAIVATGDVVYCDPPYAGTTNGYACEDFDHARFWEWVRATTKVAPVVVSEYEAPDDFEAIFSLDHATNVRRLDADRRIDRIFALKGTIK